MDLGLLEVRHNMAAAVFSKDTDLKKASKPIGDDATENDDFQRFVHVLSSLMKDEVKQELAAFFKIHDENTGGTFSGDNVEFCNLMKQRGIISSSSIKPLKDALAQYGKHHTNNIASDMFTLFKEGKLGVSTTEEKDKAGFNVFLEMLSLLMKEEVKRELESVFDLSDPNASRTFSGDNVAFCCVLEKKGIISSMSIRPLRTALRKGTTKATYVADKFFTLFTEGHLDFLGTLEEEKDVSFEQLLTLLSSLMTLEVQEALESVFDIPEEHAGNKVRGNGIAVCNLMKEKKIISPSSIQPFIIVLIVSHQRSAAKRAREMFLLYEKKSPRMLIAVKEVEEDFQEFVHVLSSLMKDEVKKDLTSFFKIHYENTGGKFSGDNVAFCNIMQHRGIINISNINPLRDALKKGDKQHISDIADAMFSLFKERRLGVSTTEEKDKVSAVSFNRLLNMLSTLMTEEVREVLESVFDTSEVHPGDKIRGSSAALCNLLKEKKIISSSSIQLFIIVLKVCHQECAAKLASEMFSLFEKKYLPLSTAVEEEEDKEYQRFLNILSLLMTKEFKQELRSFFVIPEVQADGNFKGDNIAICYHLREIGIISSLYIELLTIPLRQCGKKNGAVFIETLFKVFKERRFSASKHQNERGSDFQRFLNILSLLMTKKVKEGLKSFFDIPELIGDDKIEGDSVAYCNILKHEGIISPTYIELITIVMKAYATRPAINILDRATKLFEEKRLGDPTILKGKQETEFQKFLDVLSLLMADDVKRELELHFDFTQVQSFHKVKDHSAAICYLLKEKGIISHRTIELLTLALEGCKKRNVAEACNEIFRLFKGEKLCATANLEKEKDDFKRFLWTLSLLIAKDVEDGLVARFHISVTSKMDGSQDHGMALCSLMRERGIVSPCYVTPLTNALCEMNKLNVAWSTRQLFELFQVGQFSSSLEVEGDEENFRRFLYTLSLLISDDVKKKLVSRFHIPVMDEKDGNEDNGMALCTLLKEWGIVSPRYITPLTNALYEMNEIYVARRTEDLFKVFKVCALPSSLDEKGDEEMSRYCMTETLHDGNKTSTSSQDQGRQKGFEVYNNLQKLMGTAEFTANQEFSSEKVQFTAEQKDHVQNDEVHVKEKVQENIDNVDERQNHHLEEKGHVMSTLQATSFISNLGVSLVIGDTGVELHIPPNAFYEREKGEQMQMRIIPSGVPDESPQCFEDNTTTVVEIVPNMLRLRRNATLLLPHCLVLGNTTDCEVKIFQSHHNEGQQVLWEDISESAQPKLHAKYCEFQLREFCWLKYTIRGQSVLGKKLLLYTLGENYTTEHVTATVGYIPALSGAQEVIKDEVNEVTKGTVYKSNLQGRIIGCWQSFIFRKEPVKPLKISIEEVDPDDGWRTGGKSQKTISYSDVELSNEQSRSFTFNRIKLEAPFPVCRFEISQVEETEIHIDLAQRIHHDVEFTEQRIVRTENMQTHGQEEKVAGALRPMNEARQVQNNEMVVSPKGKVAIRGQRYEEQIFYPDMSSNAAQDFSICFESWSPFRRNSLHLELPGPHEGLPIFSELSPGDVSKLRNCLDHSNPLHMDWKMLAERLGFTSGDVWNFKASESPTEALLYSACISGKLRSKVQLMQILEDMGRLDAKFAIS